MLQKFRERLTLGLIALLPFHAFAVTALSRIIQGPDMRPMRELAVWKEGVLAVLLVIAGMEILIKIGKSMHLLRDGLPCHPEEHRNEVEVRLEGSGRPPQDDTSKKHRCSLITFIKPDWFDTCILGLMVIATVLTLTESTSREALMFGIRYNFLPLIAFLALRRVPWSDWFKTTIMKVLLAVGIIIAGYGILTFFLPQNFFVWLGYTDLVSLYLPWKPIAAYQEISGLGLRRIQSTLSGPNQLGVWLLIPWSIFISSSLRKFRIQNSEFRMKKFIIHHSSFCICIALAILLTFSRSAWIAAMAITTIALWQKLPKPEFKKLITYVLPLATFCLLVTSLIFPQIITRITSSRDHLLRPLAAIEKIVERPLGHGLASAGPASNRISDPCMYLEAGSDYSWAHDRPELCIFVAGEQVTNPETGCNCPFLPENWYLQIGVELGVLGMLLFILLVLKIIFNVQCSMFNSKEIYVYYAFVGVSIASLFLHAWEDTATAFTVWILLASCLSEEKKNLAVH